MSHQAEPSGVNDDDLVPSSTPGFKVGEKKSLSQYAELDAEDESLAKWKASLGITPGGGASDGPRVVLESLSLFSDSRAAGPIVFDLSDPEKLSGLKKTPVTIKEGSEYAVELKFKVNSDVVSGLKYLQVVKRSGINLDKLESMIGSYGPSPDSVVKRFVSEEAPSGMLARTGSYNVRSRVIDDDKTVYVDFEWTFKLGKDW